MDKLEWYHYFIIGAIGMLIYKNYFNDQGKIDRFVSEIRTDALPTLKENCNNVTEEGEARRMCYCASRLVAQEMLDIALIHQNSGHTFKQFEIKVDNYINLVIKDKMKSGKYHRQCR